MLDLTRRRWANISLTDGRRGITYFTAVTLDIHLSCWVCVINAMQHSANDWPPRYHPSPLGL